MLEAARQWKKISIILHSWKPRKLQQWLAWQYMLIDAIVAWTLWSKPSIFYLGGWCHIPYPTLLFSKGTYYQPPSNCLSLWPSISSAFNSCWRSLDLQQMEINTEISRCVECRGWVTMGCLALNEPFISHLLPHSTENTVDRGLKSQSLRSRG